MTEVHASPAPEVADAESAGATRRKRILLVEGDGFTRIVLLLRLRLAGFAVDCTSNGILGLRKLRSYQPDVLLVELKLVGLSGLDLMKAARAEPRFGNRPIYVFTFADRMHRATRKEVAQLATKVFDKSSISREDLVQTFAKTFLPHESAAAQPSLHAPTEPPEEALTDLVAPEEIEEIIAGVCEQSELLARCETPARASNGSELLSRVSSLASCAEAAGLPNLARQAEAIQNFLTQLAKHKQGYSDVALRTIARSVEVMRQIPLQTEGDEQRLTRFSAVVVDEATPSNKALQEALAHTGFDPVGFEEPAGARDYLLGHRTSIIIANVLLPEAHGLALADIKKFPLHAKTSVLFGPESTLKWDRGEELPTSAQRLEGEPLLVAELVLRALNEVQGKNMPLQAHPVSAAPMPGATGQPVARRAAAAGPAFEDGFELFSRAPQQEQAQPLPLEVQTAQPATLAAPAEEFSNHLFTAADIPSEPIFRAKPGMAGADGEAQYPAQLPENPVEGAQTDERPVEGMPPTVFQAETPPPPEPELIGEDQAAAAAFMAAATGAGENAQPILQSNTAPELASNEAAAVQQSAAATPNYGETMNYQTEIAPAEDATHSDATQQAEAVTEPNQRQDLATRVCEAEMALYHAKGQIERRDKTIEALQHQLAEASAAQQQGGQDPAVTQKAQARCAELEQELASLRQAFEGFNGSFDQQQQGAVELEKQKQQQQHALAELRRQLEAAAAGDQQARQQAEARCAQFEQQLGQARRAHEELSNKLAQEQKVGADSAARLKELETRPAGAEAANGAPAGDLDQQVRQSVAALARVTAELAKERGERQRSEQRAVELSGRLQALHQDLGRTLQAQREDQARINSLEEQQRQTTQALDRCTADLEQQQAERQLAEEQSQKAKEVNAQLRKDLAFFEEAHKKFEGARQELQSRLEASLNAAREHEGRLQRETAERQRMAESFEKLQRELQNQSRGRETLEQELQTAQSTLQEREAKLQKEAAERQRLNEALESVQRNLMGASQRDLELSKLQSALELEQIERQKQETQLARMRRSSLDAAHATRALRNSLRRQIREPVDNLAHSTRNLLEMEMGDEQKKVAEAVLGYVLLVQTRLREPELAPGEPPEAAAQPAQTT
ncbi:MAG TPA: hypothetical protein VG146_14040 [Verrucomicrobiae bacterium]|nr:hypothetical protein [Verrucomicrobiae bacterium]